MSETNDTTRVETKGEEMAQVSQLFHGTKVDGGRKTVWQMTLETFGMADGYKHKDDTIMETYEAAMEAIKEMLAKVKDDHPKWQFTLTPLQQFNSTLDDMLAAFLMWSKKDEDPRFNVSSAFRRLDSYATWMEHHRSDLEVPLTVDSVRIAAHAWQQKITHACTGHLVWWIDIGCLDVASIKSTISHSDSLRFVVWLAHLIMLDKKAQEHGMMVVEGMGHKGLISTMTMIPMDLGTKIDRFTIGVLPIKLKACYILNHRPWLRILVGLMKPFMSKKMQSRIIAIPSKADPQKVIDKEVGRDNIPVGFEGLEGKVEEDLVFGHYIK